jgi:hypothetical protein
VSKETCEPEVKNIIQEREESSRLVAPGHPEETCCKARVPVENTLQYSVKRDLGQCQKRPSTVQYCKARVPVANAPRPSSSKKYITTHPEVLSAYHSWLKWNLKKQGGKPHNYKGDR